MTLSLY
ncbi:hypothetical protein RDI58_009938 [Solanum bulbocastanum]